MAFEVGEYSFLRLSLVLGSRALLQPTQANTNCKSPLANNMDGMDDVVELGLEASDRIIDKGFDHLPNALFGKSTSKTSRKARKRTERDESPLDEGDKYNESHRSRGNARLRGGWAAENEQYDQYNQYEQQPRNSVSDRAGSRPSPGYTPKQQHYEPPFSARQGRYAYEDRRRDDSDFSSLRRSRSTNMSSRDQSYPASAREYRSSRNDYRARSYDSDSEKRKPKKGPGFKALALGAVAGGLVIGALGSSALESRRKKRKAEDKAWKQQFGKNGVDGKSEDEDDEDEGWYERNSSSSQYHPESDPYRRRSLNSR